MINDISGQVFGPDIKINLNGKHLKVSEKVLVLIIIVIIIISVNRPLLDIAPHPDFIASFLFYFVYLKINS